MRRVAVVALIPVLVAACGGGDGAGGTTPTPTEGTSTVPAPTTTEAVVPESTTSTTVAIEPLTPFPPEPSAPPVAGSEVFVLDADGTLSRVDLAAGAVVGSVQAVPAETLLHADGSLWLGSCTGETVTEVDDTELLPLATWTVGTCPTALAATGGLILVGSADGVLALDPDTGTVTPVLDAPGVTVLLAGSPLMVGRADGTVTRYEVGDGGAASEVWTLNPPLLGTVLGAWRSDGQLTVVFRDPNGHFFLAYLDWETGAFVGSLDMSPVGANVLLIRPDYLFLPTVGGGVRVIDRTTGDTVDVPIEGPVALVAHQDPEGDPAAAVLSDTGDGTAVLGLRPGEGEPYRTVDLGGAAPTVMAPAYLPGPCDPTPEVREARTAILGAANGPRQHALIAWDTITHYRDAERADATRLAGSPFDEVGRRASLAVDGYDLAQQAADRLATMRRELGDLVDSAWDTCDLARLAEIRGMVDESGRLIEEAAAAADQVLQEADRQLQAARQQNAG